MLDHYDADLIVYYYLVCIAISTISIYTNFELKKYCSLVGNQKGLDTKETIHIISFEPIGNKRVPKSIQCCLIVHECDWHILADNNESINSLFDSNRHFLFTLFSEHGHFCAAFVHYGDVEFDHAHPNRLYIAQHVEVRRL